MANKIIQLMDGSDKVFADMVANPLQVNLGSYAYNDLTKPGVYVNGSQGQGIIVIADGAYGNGVHQFVVDYDSDHIATRHKYSTNEWTAWRTI